MRCSHGNEQRGRKTSFEVFLAFKQLCEIDKGMQQQRHALQKGLQMRNVTKTVTLLDPRNFIASLVRLGLHVLRTK